jgi:hypothetical protein
MTIYFTNGETKVIDNLFDFAIKENYMRIKTGSTYRCEGTIYVPLFNVLYITMD